jgi:hypothetical protein
MKALGSIHDEFVRVRDKIAVYCDENRLHRRSEVEMGIVRAVRDLAEAGAELTAAILERRAL